MTKQVFFNPDLELTEFEAQYMQDKGPSCLSHDETNPTYTCPYDGTYCRQKEARLLAWRDSVTYRARNCINSTIYTNCDMFKRCPLRNSMECIRRLRYENIIKKLNQNGK